MSNTPDSDTGVASCGATPMCLSQADSRLELLDFALDQVREAVFLLDETARFHYVNAEACRSLGYSRDELLTMQLVDIDPTWPAGRKAEGWDVVKRLGSIDLRSRHLRKDGCSFPVDIKASFVRFGGNEYVIAMARDVTAAVAAETQLHARAEEFRALADNAPNVVIRYDRNGRRVYVNRTFCLLTGRPLEELLGKGPNEPVPVLTAPGDYEAALRDVLESGEPRQLVLQARSFSGEPTWAQARFVAERDAEDRIVSVLAISNDVTELVRSQQELQRLNRSLKTLSSGNEALVHAVDEDALLEQMCRVSVEVGGYRLAWIGLPCTGAMAPVAWAGDQAALAALHAQCGDENPVVATARSGTVRIVRDADPGPAGAFIETLRRQRLRACAAFPLNIGDDAPGVLAIYAAETDAFDAQDIVLLTEMAEDLAYGIRALRARADRERFMERLRTSMQSTIQALSNTTELRDPYTAGHQRRVASLAAAIARELGWSEERVEVLVLAATVHDIGKIAIPAEILSKPGRLSGPELSLVRTHSEAGYEILKTIDFPWPIAEYVLQHHERLNGSGYPRGLAGETILPEARVLAVADVVEAMTTHRPYRPGLGIDKALAEIESQRGVLFDAEAVDACIGLMREQRFRFD